MISRQQIIIILLSNLIRHIQARKATTAEIATASTFFGLLIFGFLVMFCYWLVKNTFPDGIQYILLYFEVNLFYIYFFLHLFE